MNDVRSRAETRVGALQNTPVISIVDDNESVRAAMENLVSSLGFVAQTFASAEEFLESPQMEATSCLISAIQMPGLSGTELQDLLLGRGHYFPTIFITAYPNSAEELRALRAGAVCILHKPLNSQSVITQLGVALDRGAVRNSGQNNPER
jgi:FixJ family two-component response regulator